MNPDLHLNIWIVAALALIVGVAACLILGVRGRTYSDRLVGFSLAGTLAALALLLMAQGSDRPSFFDLGLALTVLSYPGTLIYARFVERGL